MAGMVAAATSMCLMSLNCALKNSKCHINAYFISIVKKCLIVMEKDRNIVDWRIKRQHMSKWHRQYEVTHTLPDRPPGAPLPEDRT